MCCCETGRTQVSPLSSGVEHRVGKNGVLWKNLFQYQWQDICGGCDRKICGEMGKYVQYIAESVVLIVRPCLHEGKTQIFPRGLTSHLHKTPVFYHRKWSFKKNPGKVESLVSRFRGCMQIGKPAFLHCDTVSRLFTISDWPPICLKCLRHPSPSCFYHWCKQDYFYKWRRGK